MAIKKTTTTEDTTAAAEVKKVPARRRTTAKPAAPVPAPKEEAVKLNSPAYYTNRELSWLSFNERVLETAMEEDRPLLDQVKFLAIFYTNLDEFFMVRVANIFKLYQTGSAYISADKTTTTKLLSEIRKRATAMVNTAAGHWLNTIRPALAAQGVRICSFDDLDSSQQKFLLNRFQTEIYPILTPQGIDPVHPFPRISNVSINFIIELLDAKGNHHYARLRVPHIIPRFIFVPKGGSAEEGDISTAGKDVDIITSEEIISEFLPLLFPGYKIIGKGMFRITRNTDIEIEEDEADDLLEAVKDSVAKRQSGGVVRLETEYGMPANLTDFMIEKLRLLPFQVYRVKGPMAFSGFFDLLAVDRPKLKDKPYFASFEPHTQPARELFKNIAEHDILLFYPYQTFTSVVDFVQQAARDPKVLGIKMTLYRVGNNSPIVKALMEARQNGKQVTAVVELKARFDEERNIGWSEEMERQGVHIVYGFAGLKVHAKLCLVIRKEPNGIKRYAHIGTGNYNPGSAKNYSDLGLLTADEDICSDVTDLFNVMTGYAIRTGYRRLLVSPITMRTGITQRINEEIERHAAEGNGRIIVKCNQLVDPAMIESLYRASIAGVKVDCLVRGICCLKPGIKGVSENITVRAILGKFLEHPRVYWFGPLEDAEKSICYIGSADLMGRNLDGRIEVATPILEADLRRRIADEVLEPQIRDNCRTWTLTGDTYKRVVPADGEELVDSQDMLCRKFEA